MPAAQPLRDSWTARRSRRISATSATRRRPRSGRRLRCDRARRREGRRGRRLGGLPLDQRRRHANVLSAAQRSRCRPGGARVVAVGRPWRRTDRRWSRRRAGAGSSARLVPRVEGDGRDRCPRAAAGDDSGWWRSARISCGGRATPSSSAGSSSARRAGRLALVGGGRRWSTRPTSTTPSMALVAALDAVEPGARCSGRAYVVSNGEPRMIRELVEGICSAAGVPFAPRDVSLRVGRSARGRRRTGLAAAATRRRAAAHPVPRRAARHRALVRSSAGTR